MWIFMNEAFISVVYKDGDGTQLLVRARRAGDIERVFPQAVVRHTPRNDYAYRALVDIESIAQRMANAIRAIDYSNFKASVRERDRHDAYLDVWGAMHAYQQGG